MASTMRIVRCSKNTVVKFLANAGRICHQYQDEVLRNLPCKRLEVDEIWSFIYAKNKNVQYAKNPPRGAGDVWTWTALCADTKLLASWMVGDRTVNTALPFMTDLQSRLRKRQRVQLTTDGHRAYLEAVDRTFGADVDYAMLVKMYGNTDQNEVPAHRRYSPGQCKRGGACDRDWLTGPGQDQHQLRRAGQPDHADEHAALHAADQRFLQEAGEPRRLVRDVEPLVQLRPCPPDHQAHPGYGCRRGTSAVDAEGRDRPDRLPHAEAGAAWAVQEAQSSQLNGGSAMDLELRDMSHDEIETAIAAHISVLAHTLKTMDDTPIRRRTVGFFLTTLKAELDLHLVSNQLPPGKSARLAAAIRQSVASLYHHG